MMKKKGSFIPSLIVLRVFTSPIPHEARFTNFLIYKFVAHIVCGSRVHVSDHKTIKRRPSWYPGPILCRVEPFSYVKAFLCSNRFA